MGLIIYLATLFFSLIAIFHPWIGVINGYFSILFGPQVIWWYYFENSRHFFIIAVCTAIGLTIYIANNKINYKRLFNSQNYLLFLWLLFVLISYFFGPYVNNGPGERYFDPKYILDISTKSFLFYFVSTLCIDSEKKFKYLFLIIIFVSIYYIFWINLEYLNGNYGRIGGPKGLNSDQYGDQNNFAMFFVISLPFLYHFSIHLKNKSFKYLIWLIIPLGWHAVFLTGSRGGLLGLIAGLIPTIFCLKQKKYGIILAIALCIAFVWQGGPIMKDRARTITYSESKADESIQGRLDSWAAATKMMLEYPITGVGVASFGMAYPDFSNADPREAHNTFFQIGAESGVFAVIFYLLFLAKTFKDLWPISKKSDLDLNLTGDFSLLMSKAVLSSWLGFIVCAFFLSLQVFEQFFYLALLSNYIITKQSLN
jgi:O-antigen ligase